MSPFYSKTAQTVQPAAPAPTNDRWIADIPKNSQQTLRIQLSTFRRYELVTARVWYRAGDSDDLRPSKDGWSLRVEKLPALRDAIDQAIAAARAEGIL